MNSILEVNSLYKSFRLNGQELKVLDGISFTLDQGAFLTVLGPSGCGKSTLLRCICGFERTDQGAIRLDGKTVTSPGVDRLMVFQDFNQLFQWKTVFENILYPLQLNNVGRDRNDRNEIAERYIQMVNLADFRDAYPNQLSGGMRQRVAIARALALEPKVLLMDEPFGALDAQTRAILQKELLFVWKEIKTTVIFITHNIQEAIILGTDIMVMSLMPAKIRFMTKNPVTIPRMPETPEFMELWHKLYDHLEIKRF